MKSKYLYHTSHEACGSSDGLAVYEKENGVKDGYCWVCNTYVLLGKKYEVSDPKKIIKDISTVESILEYPVGDDLVDRGIKGTITHKYGVRVEYSETFGDQKRYYFPVYKKGIITGWHVRELPKTFYNLGDVKGAIELFGQYLYPDGGKLLIITEGCEDCLAANQMLTDLGKNYRVVSLPCGANLNSLKANLRWLETFETIILVFDQDNPGQKCAKEAAALFTPGKAKIAVLPEKDANDMLIKGKSKEFLNALYNSKDHKPEDIVGINDIYDKIMEPIHIGGTWPWPTLNKATYGRRRREIYGFGAGTGSGKTEMFKELIRHIVVDEQLPVGCIFLEEDPALTAKCIAGKMCNKKFHIPNEDYTQEEFQEAVNYLKDKVYLYNHWGGKSWEDIKAKIRYLVVGLGIKDIFLDHLTAITSGENDVNKALEKIMPEMASLSQELNFTLYYISHLATPSHGQPHEEGGRVTVSQFRGSRTIGFWTHFLFGLERNQQADGEEERNTVYLRILKDRYTGLGTGTVIRLTYNRETGRLLEELDQEF